MQPSKYQLRQTFRNIRDQIKPAYREQAAHAAATLFAASPYFQQNEHIACYLPFKSEFDVTPIIELIWNANKYCYVPVINDDEETLSFVRYQYGDGLRLNQFSILEPVKRNEILVPAKLELVLTPLTAFDVEGHRIGTGGGFYDRTFNFLLEDKTAKPIMLGLAFAVQQAESIPADPWDFLLDGVITENRILMRSPDR